MEKYPPNEQIAVAILDRTHILNYVRNLPETDINAVLEKLHQEIADGGVLYEEIEYTVNTHLDQLGYDEVDYGQEE